MKQISPYHRLWNDIHIEQQMQCTRGNEHVWHLFWKRKINIVDIEQFNGCLIVYFCEFRCNVFSGLEICCTGKLWSVFHLAFTLCRVYRSIYRVQRLEDLIFTSLYLTIIVKKWVAW